jgi:tetratricopeptide (TPR) repeat protein
MRAALRFGLMVSAVGLGAASVGGMAQVAACPMAEMSSEATPPEKLPVPVKMTGIGNGYLEISTSNAEAKMWFEQGLNLLHDFWDYESSKAFEQSVRLDPKCAMCWWGLAQAESFRGDNVEWTRSALKNAVLLAKDKKHTTEAERLYIKAADEAAKAQGTRSGKGPNTGGKAGTKVVAYKDSNETKALRKLVQKYPEDIQAKIFLAESLMDGFDKQQKPKAGTVQGQAILEALLVAHPEDTAANHYWIHAMEPSLNPERALVSARKLGPLTAASGHMVHMPGHIFFRVGDYETARLSFVNSMRVDETYMKTQGVTVEDDWNYVHNMMYLIADLLEAGRVAEASEVSLKLNAAHGNRGTSLYLRNARDQITRLNEALPVALRAGEWSRAVGMLEASKVPVEWVNLVELKDSLLEYTRGMAALANGDRVAAEKFSDALDARMKMPAAGAAAASATAKKGVPAKGTPSAASAAMPAGMPGMKKASDKDAAGGAVHGYMQVAALELRGAVEMALGKAVQAEATLVKAAGAEHDLGYREPPLYVRPVSETRGDLLMRAGKFKEAKAAYETALAERPNSGYPLYGIAQAAAAAGDVAGAKAAYGTMLKTWAKADAGLPQVVAAKAWMGEHGGVAAGE